jgi:hypothetical protein
LVVVEVRVKTGAVVAVLVDLGLAQGSQLLLATHLQLQLVVVVE